MEFKSGVWPTMITAYDKNNNIDINGNKLIARRLMELGADGIFAVCQSSEMFFLSTEEKVELARAVVEEVGDKIQVIVSGHTSDNLEEQIKELKEIAKTNPCGLVLVTNRLDINNEGFETFKENTMAILEAIPDIDFGLYECPYPYLRLLTEEELKWCAQTKRIKFIKDVCCNEKIQTNRIKVVKDTKTKLFNANTQTILHSLKEGYSGYSGVMGNFHIDIYKWLYENYDKDLEKAQTVQQWLTNQCKIEGKAYPVNVKYYLNSKGMPINVSVRSKSILDLDVEEKQKCYHLQKSEQEMREGLHI